jgi:hypothetical protein
MYSIDRSALRQTADMLYCHVDHAITYDSKGGKVYVFGGKGVGRSSK